MGEKHFLHKREDLSSYPQSRVNAGCVAEVSVTEALLLGDERQRQGELLEACRTASPTYTVGDKNKQKSKDILHKTRKKVEDKDRHSDLHACTMHCGIYILSQTPAHTAEGGKDGGRKGRRE